MECFLSLRFQKQPLEVFCKKKVLRYFAKFTGKHLCQSLFFNKVADWGLQLYLKRLWHRCFSVNCCEISMNTLSYRTPPVAAFETTYMKTTYYRFCGFSVKMKLYKTNKKFWFIMESLWNCYDGIVFGLPTYIRLCSIA